MKITPLETKVVQVGDDLNAFLESSIQSLAEKSIVVVTSKVVALCEGAVVKVDEDTSKSRKHQLIREQAELFTQPHSSKYDVMLTVKNHVLAVSAGIDESNTGGYYVLWPQDPQQSADQIWHFLRHKFQVQSLGVILSDSKTFPLRWGVVGTAIAHSGFIALNDKRGSKDLFGRELLMTTVNVAEAVAAAAVLEMGEADECRPIAVVEDLSMIEFQQRVPNHQELAALINTLEDDVYAPILMKADWKKGGALATTRSRTF